MIKDFKKWHGVKEHLDGRRSAIFFHEREVWWCSLGVNIGFEQDGTGKDFQRPVVIIKKFNLDACLVVPLTTTQKKGRYYFKVGEVDGRDAVAVLSQVRFIDRKRLANKVGVLDEDIFRRLFEALIQANFNKKVASKKVLPRFLGRGRGLSRLYLKYSMGRKLKSIACFRWLSTII